MVHSTNATLRRSGIRDTVVVMGVLLGLLALQFVVPFQPAQIPGYFLLIGFSRLKQWLRALTVVSCFTHYSEGTSSY